MPARCNVPVLQLGAPGGTAQSHRLIATTDSRWQIGCGGTDRRRVPYQRSRGYPLATMVVYGARVTLQDNSRPAPPLGGPLLGPGWHKPDRPDHLQRLGQFGHPYGDASRRSPRQRCDARSCDFTYRVPCANADQAFACSSPASLPDGQYPVHPDRDRRGAEPADASTARVAVDGTPPSVDLRRPRGRISGSSRSPTAASGLAAATDLGPEQPSRAVPELADDLRGERSARPSTAATRAGSTSPPLYATSGWQSG